MKTKKNLSKFTIVISIVAFCLMALSGCGFGNKDNSKNDNDSNDLSKKMASFDASKIPDAIPKVESRIYSKKSYVINGHRYRVLKTASGYHARGVASWYGPKFNGKLTATEERFNLYKMTAASPILPLPTYVRVTNLSNGKQVIVKVNDRGPYHGHRILDLSYAAAKKLGFAKKGVAHVDVQAINAKRWLANSAYRQQIQKVKFANSASNKHHRQAKKKLLALSS